MEYDERMGIAYDTIFYGVLCFNFEKIDALHWGGVEIPDDHRYFYRLKETAPPPSPELYPFFYCDFTRPSALSVYFLQHFLFGQEDFLTFWERLLQHTDLFWPLLFGHYGPALTDPDLFPIRDSSALVQKILALPFDRELILQLINAAVNPETTLRLLSDFLRVIYRAVQELFKRENKAIQSILKIFMTDHFLECMTVVPTFKYSLGNKRTYLSFALLNPLTMVLIAPPAGCVRCRQGAHCQYKLHRGGRLPHQWDGGSRWTVLVATRRTKAASCSTNSRVAPLLQSSSSI
ncbi:MAG: hypothetical protein HFJ80_03015 [Clostridiales bacterium]|nr:hypothetical protein [Clostridiales bacterium]